MAAVDEEIVVVVVEGRAVVVVERAAVRAAAGDEEVERNLVELALDADAVRAVEPGKEVGDTAPALWGSQASVRVKADEGSAVRVDSR